jgi:hydroxyethylthiazole kinase-like uncharacterized protein yjeF
VKVCKVEEMRELDSRAVKEYGIPTEILMENAGEAVYFAISKEVGVKQRNFVVFCGSGNNGGDGFVVARKLHSNGGNVIVFLLAKKDRYEGAPKKNLEIIAQFPIKIEEISSVAEAKDDVFSADVIIDAIFGTGLDRDVSGLYADIIQLINKSGKKVFSVDIPSGINGNTGQEMGSAVRADCTVTFGLPKTGNLLYPGYQRGGKLYVTHISFPPSLYEKDAFKIEVAVPSPLPERMPNTAKMDYGPVLVIAGAANYFWAPFASAYSILRSGGGYVYLACPESITSSIAQGGKEIVFLPMQETGGGSIAINNKAELLEAAARMRIVVIGPGLSLNNETQQLVKELATEIDKPVIIDGDGITAISQDITLLKKRKAVTILTPHTGEMSRITGLNRSDIEHNLVNVLQDTAHDLNSIIVLKGPHSLIGYPDGRVIINMSGSTGNRAGMATAGSGDVLNGTIAGMYCLGLSSEEAVQAGVFIHGLSGDLAAEEKGADGMTAQDILDLLPYAVQYYRENLDMIAENYYDSIFVI